jgi:hypothetical protein
MQLDYAIEGYWLAKRRDFSANTVNDDKVPRRPPAHPHCRDLSLQG